MKSLYDFQVKNNKGEMVSINNYKGKTLLIVNTASKCGFTPQYEELEALYKKYKDQGFEILAFPCNQFGNQEPGADSEIAQFCSLNFNTSFALFSKIDVNGDNADPFFEFLKEKAPGALGSKMIKWNFTKFLVDKTGENIERFAPTTAPLKMEKDILKRLG